MPRLHTTSIVNETSTADMDTTTTTTTTTTTAPLPFLPTDDVVTYPSIRLGGLRGKKLSLDQYFGAMDAVII